MSYRLLLFTAFASLSVSFGQEPAAQPPPPRQPPRFQKPPGVQIIPEVEIGRGGDRVLHVEIARPQVPPPTPMPAVLWVHGGGWSRGSYKGNQAMALAAKGYFTATIEYRLSGEATWPAQIEDCKLGVRWLRANAAKYNVDPDKIGCWGSSAGGHLVACMGVMDDPRFEGTGGYPGVSSRVQAVVDYFGPTDMTKGSEGIQRAKEGVDAPGPLGLFGAHFAEKPELWKDGSPLVYVKAGDPPFLIAHGDQDLTVPIAHSEKLVAALKKAGVPVEFIVVKGAEHDFRPVEGVTAVEPDRPTLETAVLAFFDQHLKGITAPPSAAAPATPPPAQHETPKPE